MKKNEIDEDNIEHSLLVIDEAHRIINSKRAKEVELLLQFVREGRKLFAGLGRVILNRKTKSGTHH